MNRSIQTVRLRDDQWGNQIMQEVAEALLRGPNPPGVVTVQEHAGWWLSFALLAGEVTVVGTANDLARFDERVLEFWREMHAECAHSRERYGRCCIEHRPELREPPALAAA